MSDLIDFVIGKHGGLERWERATSVTAEVHVYGGFWAFKGQPDLLGRVLATRTSTVMPLVIVAVVVAYVTAARLEPAPPARHMAPPTVPTATGAPPAVEPGKALPTER